MRPRPAARLFVPVLVVLAGCSPATTSPKAPVSVSAQASATPSASGEPMHDDSDERAELRAAPGEWDSSAEAAAVDVADAAMAAWAESDDLPADAWWSALAPTLSVGARAAYEATDPANVPVRTADESGRVESTPSVYLARVAYGTNDGVWLVTVSRAIGAAGAEEFAVERLQPATVAEGGERA